MIGISALVGVCASRVSVLQQLIVGCRYHLRLCSPSRDQVPWVSVPLGTFHLQWGILVPHTPMAPACSLGITLSPAVNRDCNGVLNCPWYHGCSESKHGFVAARRCVCSYDCCSCGAAAWVVHLFPLPTNPRGRGWVGECSMLARCELRHTAGVDLHASGMLHSFDCLRQALLRCR